MWEPPVPRREAMREALGRLFRLHSCGAQLAPVTNVLDTHTARLLGIADAADLDLTDSASDRSPLEA